MNILIADNKTKHYDVINTRMALSWSHASADRLCSYYLRQKGYVFANFLVVFASLVAFYPGQILYSGLGLSAAVCEKIHNGLQANFSTLFTVTWPG